MTDNYASIGALWDTAGALTGVKYAILESDMLVAVELRFDGATATLYAQSEFDTVRVTREELKLSEVDQELEPDEECRIVDVARKEPWMRAIGHRAVWIWLIRNQQGYEDGVRFEFSTPEADDNQIIELVVVASGFQVFGSQEFPFREERAAPTGTA